ncbi:MAG: 50S ribosomal protein L10 [Spirochaetaceae bacterium]|nr:MAG: 50S ribosomal protein L10 [Spirochaetaceae bacterium]
MAEKTQRINEYKETSVKKLKDIVENAHDLIFADFRGLTVAQLTDLRKKLRAEEAQFTVVKNNYMNLALTQLGKPDVSDLLKGPTATTFIRKDVGPVAKILVEFAKEVPLKLKGGIVEGKRFSQEEMTALSKLPSRQELIARIMGSLNAPATNMVLVLNGVITKLVRTLKAVADKKQQG